MELLRAPRALALFALLLPACTIDGLDDLASSGSDDDDQNDEEGDTEDEESGSDEDDDPKPSIDTGNDPTEPNPTTGLETGADPSETSGYETSGWDTEGGSETGSFPGDASCDAFCTLDLSCYADYASVEECVQVCEADAASFGVCADAFGGLNACLGALDCEQYAMFWDALSQIEQGVEVGSFPCDYALVELAECSSGGGGGAG